MRNCPDENLKQTYQDVMACVKAITTIKLPGVEKIESARQSQNITMNGED